LAVHPAFCLTAGWLSALFSALRQHAHDFLAEGCAEHHIGNGFGRALSPRRIEARSQLFGRLVISFSNCSSA